MAIDEYAYMNAEVSSRLKMEWVLLAELMK